MKYIHVLLAPRLHGRKEVLVDGEWCYDISDLVERANTTQNNLVRTVPTATQQQMRARQTSARLKAIGITARI